MDPLSPKQLRGLNSAYTSVHPDKDELSEEVAIQNLAENLFDLLKKEDIIPQDTELTEGLKSKLVKLGLGVGGALGIDQGMFDGAFTRLTGYGAKNLRDYTKGVGSDIHNEIDNAESGKTSGPSGPTAPTGPTGGPTGPTGGPKGPTGLTAPKDPYTPEVVNDPDRYIYNGQEYRFENGKLVKIKK
tara:strand:- start:886 stop:1443 length:558 start_codon:yes stop_codon:yes gene_type:complete